MSTYLASGAAFQSGGENLRRPNELSKNQSPRPDRSPRPVRSFSCGSHFYPDESCKFLNISSGRRVEKAIKKSMPEVYDVIVHIEPRGNVEDEKYGLTPEDAVPQNADEE